MLQSFRSAVNTIRDKYTPAYHTSTFRATGEITPEEFVAAGDFLVYKFPSWSWSDASHPSKRAPHLPDGKQFLVTRGVPCRRRLGGQDVAGGEVRDVMIKVGEGEGEEEWLSAGGEMPPGAAVRGEGGMEDRSSEVRSVDDSGRLGDAIDEDEIPDMEDDEDDEEAIIRDGRPDDGTEDGSLRTYTLYIMYTPYYRTPRLYLSGYTSSSTPLPPERMMDDIVGDYKDKTVTLEAFPFVDSGLRMASIHPCRHAAVMKILLDRADAALKLRVAKLKAGKASEDEVISGMEGLEISSSAIAPKGDVSHSQESKKEGEEWEVLQESEGNEDEIAIRVDQYLVVFLKFMASVTPGIEHDFTIGV